VSSNVSIDIASTAASYLRLSNHTADGTTRSGYLQISAAGNLGLWDIQNNKWVVKSSTAGEVSLNGTAEYAKACLINYKNPSSFNVSPYNAKIWNIEYTTINSLNNKINIFSFVINGDSTTFENPGHVLTLDFSSVIYAPKCVTFSNCVLFNPLDTRGIKFRAQLATDKNVYIFTQESKLNLNNPMQFQFIYTS
jgi:hypothetical protein